MEFCSKCGGLMMPSKAGSKTILTCRKCGKKMEMKEKSNYKLSAESNRKAEKIVVVENKKDFEALPETEVQCPKCGNNKAFWWMMQTRAGDEPPTRFHKCTKCGHTWREYE